MRALVGEHLTNQQIAARLYLSVRTVESHVSSLPTQLTSFVGRRAERAALARAIAEHRLVTAVGPGGVGKTRLALAVAQAVADRAASGEVWVTSTLRDLTAGSGLSFEPVAELEVPSLGRSVELDVVS